VFEHAVGEYHVAAHQRAEILVHSPVHPVFAPPLAYVCRPSKTRRRVVRKPRVPSPRRLSPSTEACAAPVRAPSGVSSPDARSSRPPLSLRLSQSLERLVVVLGEEADDAHGVRLFFEFIEILGGYRNISDADRDAMYSCIFVFRIGSRRVPELNAPAKQDTRASPS